MASTILADNGVSSGSAGLKSTADSSGVLALASGTGTTAVTIDTSQNVGIGTSSPAVKLDVNGSAYVRAGNIIGLYNTDNTNQYQIYNGGSSGANIGQLIFVQGGIAERMRINASGNVGINTASPTQKLSVSNGSLNVTGGQLIAGATSVYSDGTIGTPSLQWNAVTGAAAGALCIADGTGNLGAIFFRNPNGYVGNISTSGSNTTYTTTSDYRLKENIAPMAGALSVISQLKPVTYTWKVDGSSGQGFIAHELQEVVPDCVSGEKDGVDADGNPRHQSIDTSFLVATLTAAIQEQQALITTLTERISALEAK